MDFRDYLTLANNLLNEPSEAAWRSAVSRAYYAAFHVAGQLLEDLNFRIPQADRAHAYLWMRHTNSGSTDVNDAGWDLKDLRRERNRADYEGWRQVSHIDAMNYTRMAEATIRILDNARQEPTRTLITDTMKTYERDVLKDVTWHS